ncbi:MAG: hypothetical protein ACMXYL_05160 [Candidatus Woesearchaeota archaeon]
MDKPIEIAIMLFVALAVGIAILAFVNNTLDSSRMAMHNLLASQSPLDEKIFQSPTITEMQATALVISCYESNRGRIADESALCTVYRVNSPVPGTVFPEGTIDSSLGEFEAVRPSDDCRAFFIIYRSYENRVVVEC